MSVIRSFRPEVDQSKCKRCGVCEKPSVPKAQLLFRRRMVLSLIIDTARVVVYVLTSAPSRLSRWLGRFKKWVSLG
jgi:hypothetical protein